jgi:hypothetical protein
MSLQDYVNGTAERRGYPLDPEMVNILEIDLSNARDREEFKIEGDFLFCVDCDKEGRTFEVFLNSDQQDPFPMGQDGGFSGIPFDPIYISNEAQSGVKAKIMYIRSREGEQAPFWTEPAKALSTFTEKKADQGTTQSDSTVAPNNQETAIADHDDRRRVSVVAHPDNDEIIRAGYSVGDTQGVPLVGGASYDFNTTQEVLVRNPSGNANNQTYMVNEAADS